MFETTGLYMKYFVLKPRGDSTHAIASRCAMRAYAQFIEGEDPDLAKALYAWVTNEVVECRTSEERSE